MITIAIGTYNRLGTLERTIKSYAHLVTPHELVIVDNGSDDPACVALLNRLERTSAVKKVYRLPGCIDMDEAQANFNVAIRDQFENGDAEWFAISEADVCFEGTHPEALGAYMHLAKTTGCAVGPHLRVDRDIPTGYPLRSRVLACETWMQYRADMMRRRWPGRPSIYYNPCQIDTTFHLFPRTRHFDRLRMNPIRVGAPYDAMHLDWYLDVRNPTPENAILIPNERPMGSWGKAWIRDYWLWYQAEGPERALALLMEEPLDPTDLCNVSFQISWALQYGVGCEVNLEESAAWLRGAIPRKFERYWALENDWMDAIYREDFSALRRAA